MTQLTQVLQDTALGVEGPGHAGQREHARLGPLFLRRVPGVVDQDVARRLLVTGGGGAARELLHVLQQGEQHLNTNIHTRLN